MSAPSVVCSQSLTVLRKLEIMTLTPTITLTAIVSAATAIEVRLSERVTARGAMRPSRPKIVSVSGRSQRMASVSTMGVKKALPTTMQNSAAKLTTILRVGSCSSTRPITFNATATAVKTGTSRRVVSS